MSDLPPLSDPDDFGLDPEKLTDMERQIVEEFRPPVDVPEDAPVPEDSPASPVSDGETDAGDAPLEADVEVTDEEVAAAQEVIDYWDGVAREQQEEARRLLEWRQQLDENALGLIDTALDGKHVLVPADQIAELQKNYDLLERMRRGETTQEPAPEYAPTYDTSDIPPEVALRMEAMERQIAQQEERAMKDSIDAQARQAATEIEEVGQTWRAQNADVDDTLWDEINRQVIDSNQFGPMAQKYGNRQAAQMLWDQALTSRPEYVQRQIDAQVKSRLDEELNSYSADAQRGSRASAISGAATAPPDLSGMDPDEAMIEALRIEMGR